MVKFVINVQAFNDRQEKNTTIIVKPINLKLNILYIAWHQRELTSKDGGPHPLPSRLSMASVSESNCLRKLSWQACSHCKSAANLQQCKSTKKKKKIDFKSLSRTNWYLGLKE